MVPVRVISANLWNGRADPAALDALVRDLAPDAVLAQELGPEQAAVLAARLPGGLLRPARDHTGLGIALRRPAPVGCVPLPYRDALWTELALSGGEDAGTVELVNVHILAPHAPPPWWMRAVRRGQLAGLLAHLDARPGRRRLLMGDLNAPPGWGVYRQLAARLDDAAILTARGNGHRPEPTWGPWSGAPRLLRIDHAFVAGLTVRALRVVPLPGSDHSALVIDVAGDPGWRQASEPVKPSGT
jgi:endonuclease/exonuclease/phosphatase (EEP) superfamily protein YafD